MIAFYFVLNCITEKTQIDLELDITETEDDNGKKHWHIKSWQTSFDLKDKSDVMFYNLFDGNEVLGKQFFHIKPSIPIYSAARSLLGSERKSNAGK